MTIPNKMRLPTPVFKPLIATFKWLNDKPSIVEITEEQRGWFTKLFIEACQYSPEYSTLNSPNYSMEYNENGMTLLLFSEELEVVGRVPVVEDESLPCELPHSEDCPQHPKNQH